MWLISSISLINPRYTRNEPLYTATTESSHTCCCILLESLLLLPLFLCETQMGTPPSVRSHWLHLKRVFCFGGVVGCWVEALHLKVLCFHHPKQQLISSSNGQSTSVNWCPWSVGGSLLIKFVLPFFALFGSRNFCCMSVMTLSSRSEITLFALEKGLLLWRSGWLLGQSTTPKSAALSLSQTATDILFQRSNHKYQLVSFTCWLLICCNAGFRGWQESQKSM